MYIFHQLGLYKIHLLHLLSKIKKKNLFHIFKGTSYSLKYLRNKNRKKLTTKPPQFSSLSLQFLGVSNPYRHIEDLMGGSIILPWPSVEQTKLSRQINPTNNSILNFFFPQKILLNTFVSVRFLNFVRKEQSSMLFLLIFFVRRVFYKRKFFLVLKIC